MNDRVPSAAKVANLPYEEKRKLLASLLRQKALQPRLYPLTFIQQQVWLADNFASGDPLCNILVGYRLNGPLNVQALERSFNEIVRRHEMLRTNFDIVDGRLVQIVFSTRFVPMTAVDLTKIPIADRETEVQRLASEEAARPFDLTSDRLLRTTLLHLAEDEHVLLRSIHRILADGWSLGVMALELGSLYEAFCHNRTPNLPDLQIQYADHALAQQEIPRAVLDSRRDYWRVQLREMPIVVDALISRTPPARRTSDGDHYFFSLPKTLITELNDFGRREGASLFTILISAFYCMIHAHTGHEDIVVACPASNR